MPAFFGSRSHYRDHLRPIAARLGEEVLSDRKEVPPGPVVVASYIDLWVFRDRPAIFVEHGAGQSYSSTHPSYSGGTNRGNVVLFICPSETVAERNRAAYPGARAVAVGCPKMDRWLRAKIVPRYPVAVSFHWFTGGVAPEARSALPFFEESLGSLVRYCGPSVLGTGHPRVLHTLRKVYDRVGISTVETREVFERAKVLVVDNSSVGWEFLSLDRPVVWLNAPWYRKDVEHGLRFWEYADAGIEVDRPEDVVPAVTSALSDPEPFRSRRREVVPKVYEYVDGSASERAANAIREVLG